MDELNERQRAVYAFIKQYVQQNNFPPTVREICAAVGMRSTSSAHRYLKELADKGYITVDSAKQRSISLTNAAPVAQLVPLVGTVAAGVPILAFDNIQERIPLPHYMLHGALEGEVFLLAVKGESMINAGINDGDMVLVHSNLKPENGEIAVVRLQGEAATVKRIFYEKTQIRLQPENPEMQPIYSNDAVIVGKVIGLLRRY